MGQTDVDLTKYATVKDLAKIDLTGYVRKTELPTQQDLTTYLRSADFVSTYNNATGLKNKSVNADSSGVAVLSPTYSPHGINIFNGGSGGWTHFNAENKGVNYIRGNTDFEQKVNFKSGITMDRNLDTANTNFRVFGGTKAEIGAGTGTTGAGVFARAPDTCSSIIMPYGTVSIQYANCGQIEGRRVVIPGVGTAAATWDTWIPTNVNIINSSNV